MLTVVGVLNVTPDSFSDGGRYVDVAAAVEHGIKLHADGAAFVDVGGESTRPGARRIDADEECRRVLPLIRELTASGVATSIDTYRAEVAAAALEAGAGVINDVSGGLGDPRMAAVAADAGCPWILMHWRGHSADMQQLAHYDDVVSEVVAELTARVDAALAAGVAPGALIVDPGLGFAKTADHNWALLNRLDAIMAMGFPVLVGASRKSFLGRLLADPAGTPRPVDGRESATTALTAYVALRGGWGVRVHDVRASVDAAQAIAAVTAAGPSSRYGQNDDFSHPPTGQSGRNVVSRVTR
jgi:dihydropteroate synthase